MSPARHLDPTLRRHKWRWDLAWWLNKLPGVCWANLVSWALGHRAIFNRFGDGDIRQDSICRLDADACGRCYCGKIATKETP